MSDPHAPRRRLPPPATPRGGEPRAEGGFSLLEVMVAVAIFALTVMTLLVVRGRAVEQAHLARNIEIAQRYGKLLLEDILLGNRVYTDGDAGTFEEAEASHLTYEVAVEEVTVAGTPPDEEEEGRSRGAASVGGRAAERSKMDSLFGDDSRSSRKGSSSSSGDAEGDLAADAGSADESPGTSSGKKKKKKGGGGGGLFGDGEDSEPEILFRVTVKIHYPVLDEDETLTLETFVPPPPEESEEDEDAGLDDGKSDGGSQGGGKKKGGGKGQGKKKGQRGGAEDDLFGGG